MIIISVVIYNSAFVQVLNTITTHVKHPAINKTIRIYEFKNNRICIQTAVVT